MKAVQNADGTTTLILSRRNILSLLAKLDGNPPNSACTLGGGEEAEGFWVQAEEDDTHYGRRGFPPGSMHPDTEAAISARTRV